MELEVFAPVVIPTLNRFEHFKRCIESLARCTHADKTELIIGLDYPPSTKYIEGWKKICDYVPKITGFKKVTVFKRKENYGVNRNITELREYAFARYDRIITTEDDNEFSPCFLDYINKALELYKDDDRVMWVSGYIQPRFYGIDTKDNVLFMHAGNAWGMGQWREKENKNKPLMDSIFADILFSLKNSLIIFRRIPFRLAGSIDCYVNNNYYGDYKRGCICSLYDKYQLLPARSLVRNWGQDGSGLHSGVNMEITREEISEATTFDLKKVPVEMRQDVAKIVWETRLPKDMLHRCYALARILLSYMVFRIKYRKKSK